ncbi:YegP family protein [Pseudoroseicyclus sp. H15]
MAYKIYKDKGGEWRWHYKSGNGNIIADSGEGYVNKADCERGIEIMKNSSGDAVEEE